MGIDILIINICILKVLGFIMIECAKDDELFVGDDILKEFWDCRDCGLCCKFFQCLPIYKEEIEEMADFIGIDSEVFKKSYTIKIESNTDEVSFKIPCQFLSDNTCEIYPVRGFICRTYPLCINLTTNIAVLSGIYFCPQATQFYESLLVFLKEFDIDTYENLLLKEKEFTIKEEGFEIQGSAQVFSQYLDSLYEKKNEENN